MTLDESVFLHVDLNALLILLVVYRERGVSRAAARLNLTQPAVSNTLAKLRAYFHDPLFTRHARGMTPTPKAKAIMKKLSPALMDIQEVLLTTAR
jgi:DNA-binding transcriptional LysR family regulator